MTRPSGKTIRACAMGVVLGLLLCALALGLPKPERNPVVIGTVLYLGG